MLQNRRMRLRHTVAIAVTATALVGTGVAVIVTPGAQAQNNGVAKTPPRGWSSWSFVRDNPTAAKINAAADAIKRSGLGAAGYSYVNVDDSWYVCPSSRGPAVDAHGRWVADTKKFPNVGRTNGIQAVAAHVHGDGLKFGIYVTPGISKQAVAKRSPIAGTRFTANQIATSSARANYNCRGMVGIDYSKPGAQAFVNSWADQFAGWGVDYVKIDGVGVGDVADVKAWSIALRQTGRPIHLELSNKLAIGSVATWKQFSNGWRVGPDVECYCPKSKGSSYPLTSYGHVARTFDLLAAWQPYAAPGGWNDYDSLELGNGANDGLTVPERQTMMSQLALASAPMLLGSDVTRLDATDLAMLKNRGVLAVQADGVAARRIVKTATYQVFAKRERSGAIVVGVFNTRTAGAQNVTFNLSRAGVGGATNALDLWSGRSIGRVGGNFTATIAAGGVKLIKIG